MRAQSLEKFKILTLRNLKIYFRDYMTIFYSLLSMIITIGLMVFFLGDSNARSIANELSAFPGRNAINDAENAKLLILIWTGGGILSINAVTVTLACFSNMIEDRREGRLNAIYTSPIKRSVISLSYIAYAWVASTIICIITLTIFECIAAAKGMPLFSFGVHLQLIGIICINSWTFSALMFMLALLIKANGAWGAIGTIVGSLVGFFGGIYFPIGAMGSKIQSIIKCFPVIYSASAFRSVMMKEMMEKTFEGLPSEFADAIASEMGITITVFNHKLTVVSEMTLVAAFGILFMMISIIILKKNKLKDR